MKKLKHNHVRPPMEKQPKSKDMLASNEYAFVEEQEQMIDTIMEAIAEVSFFNLGDYLIGFRQGIKFNQSTDEEETIWTPITNSYGTPKKFKVVHIDKHKIPYVRELNKCGDPWGPLECLIDYSEIDNGIEAVLSKTYKLDPAYADAIILGDVENYNPVEEIQKSAAINNEISVYNKSIKVPRLETEADVRRFAMQLKVGDLYWKSAKTCWLIMEVKSVPYTDYKKFLTVKTNSGDLLNLSLQDLWLKPNFYTKQPRTYKELKDPK